MANEFDVAKYITECKGEISAMKLQKLMYYAQAWSLVWEEKPLFDADFQAWANGPVLPSIYDLHRGMFLVSSQLFPRGDSDRLAGYEKSNIDKVLGFYGEKTVQWLSDLTHREDPWLNARNGLLIGVASNAEISKGAIHEYYSSL